MARLVATLHTCSFRLTQTIGVLFLLAWLARSWARLILRHGGDAQARQTAENLSAALPQWSTTLLTLFFMSAALTLVFSWLSRKTGRSEKDHGRQNPDAFLHDARSNTKVEDGATASRP
jgi:hypothetical protein